MKEKLFNSIGNIFSYLSDKFYCFADGHRWCLVTDDFVYCERCNKAITGKSAIKYYKGELW